MPLPLTGNGIGLPGSIAPTQPTNQPSKGEESKRNEEDKKVRAFKPNTSVTKFQLFNF